MSAEIPAYKLRARQQIEMGEALAKERGLPCDPCVDAAHFLIPDGGAARQGDDPATLLLPYYSGLSDLLPRAVEIERDAVRSWTPEEWRDVETRLEGLGPSRQGDLTRLRAIRWAMHHPGSGAHA